MGSGLARGAYARGKRVALGDGKRIIWGPYSAEVFRDNPNLAPPGSEGARDIEWVHYCKGHRIYNTAEQGRWRWNYDYRPTPGEFYFSPDELRWAAAHDFAGVVILEPNLPNKPNSPNKQWGLPRWQALADGLVAQGYSVAQFSYGRPNVLLGVNQIKTHTFRHAALAMSRAHLAVLPEGGLHHAAAAVRLPAVVLFGGFAPPAVLGYDGHTNLTGGAEACGSFTQCSHCRAALDQITVEEVLEAVRRKYGADADAQDRGLHEQPEAGPEGADRVSEVR